jgi:hypothetical protein
MMTLIDTMFELYRMNAGVGKLGIHLFSVYGFFCFFFPEKKIPKQICTRVLLNLALLPHG